MNEELYAGFLCATHVGKTIRVNGFEGKLHHLSASSDKPNVRLILYSFDEAKVRTDGALRKLVDVLLVDPRAIVEVLAD